MSKVKNPFFGLGATGTIANSLTYQTYPAFDRVISIPDHPDPKTLGQIYQRARFYDAKEYWHSLSPAQKHQYRLDGAPHGRTAYQQLLSVYLADPIDQQLWLRLDELTGNTAADSSGKDNHGTIFGPLSVPGVLDYARWFDGIDDRIVVPNDPTLQISGAFTILLWYRLEAPLIGMRLLGQRIVPQYSFHFAQRGDGRLQLNLSLAGGGPLSFISTTFTPHIDTWIHLAALYSPSAYVQFFADAVSVGLITVGVPAAIHPSTNPLYISDPATTFHGRLDDIRLYTRALTAQHIAHIYQYQRHPP